MVAVMSIPAATSASVRIGGHKDSAAVLAGLKYYKGKSVEFIAPSTPGGGYDLWARLLAPYLSTYLHATVTVTDITPGNTIPGQDTIARSEANGLTIGLAIPVSDAELAVTDTPGLNFNFAREALIGGTGTTPQIWLSRISSSYTTAASVITSATPVPEAITSTGTANTILKLANAAFGVHATLVTGYANNAALEQGFLRGDAPVTQGSLSSFAPYVTGGQARALYITERPPKANAYYGLTTKIPTVAQLAKEYPPKTATEKNALKTLEVFDPLGGYTVFAPSATPANRVAALRFAMQSAMQNKSLISQANIDGLIPTYATGAQLKQQYLDAVKYGSRVASILEG
jgi:tripartite-type tricarboxylate transporter receptor subunit TctC